MKKTDHKERINYIKEVMDDGKVAYTGVSVNYNCCCSSWESVEDLESEMKCMLEMWLDFGKEQIANGLEMKELTPEEWEAKEDKIDYWEIDRIKRLLQRPSINAKFVDLINQAIGDSNNNDGNSLAAAIMNRLINQPNE